MRYTEIEDTFKCDGCDKTFKGKDIHLEDPASNINIIAAPSNFMYVAKDDKVLGGGDYPSLDKGDRLLGCPHCKQIHLFGFDKVKGLV
jgi:hypothetical protein